MRDAVRHLIQRLVVYLAVAMRNGASRSVHDLVAGTLVQRRPA